MQRLGWVKCRPPCYVGNLLATGDPGRYDPRIGRGIAHGVRQPVLGHLF